MSYKIGVDGGGTKTEGILVDAGGRILARHGAAGSNPSSAGPERAADAAREVLDALRARAEGPVAATLLCMAGAPAFWSEFASGLGGFGAVAAHDDSFPVLELATEGGPGLALHAGTGSFVVARAPDGSVHYAGGLGWRFGDEGGGYDIGRRAVAQALRGLQAGSPPGGLARAVGEAFGDESAAAILRAAYADPQAGARVAALAPAALALAESGDAEAERAVAGSLREFLALARETAARLFPGAGPGRVRAGLSGPILNHPFARRLLEAEAPFALVPVADPPIEGVRRLLLRL